jgi:hypothetical protein
MLTRREFVVAGASALAASSLLAQGSENVPAILDHILLGSPDLQQGVEFVQAKTGVRAAFGGVHPGRGTQNALLSLGERHYLEIIAPDPKQAGAVTPMLRADLLAHLRSLTEPRLIGWAAHPGDLDAFASRLRAAGLAFTGPTAGSRKRPDGRLLQWQTLNLQDDASGLLPFFIEWSEASAHPSTDAPKGCRLAHFELAGPDPAALRKKLAILELDVPVVKNAAAQIRARFVGPKGELEISS